MPGLLGEETISLRPRKSWIPQLAGAVAGWAAGIGGALALWQRLPGITGVHIVSLPSAKMDAATKRGARAGSRPAKAQKRLAKKATAETDMMAAALAIAGRWWSGLRHIQRIETLTVRWKAALIGRLAALPRWRAAWLRRADSAMARSKALWAVGIERAAAAMSRSQTAWIVGITGALAATLTGLFIWMSLHSRQIVLADTYVASSNLALSVEEFVAHTVDSIDKSLRGAVEEIGTEHAREKIRAVLSEKVRLTPEISDLMIIDPSGRVRFSSAPLAPRLRNVADRKYFTAARDGAGIMLAVGEPLRPQIGKRAIFASLRFKRADGSFGGVVAATITPDYMQRYFSTLGIGEHGIIALETIDGTLLLRRPEAERDIGRNFGSSVLFKGMLPWASSGVFPMQYQSDGLWRIVGYQRVGKLPLVVEVALSRDEALMHWRRSTFIQAAVVVIMLTVLGLMALVLHRLLQARALAHRKLRATVGELERARVAAEASSRVKSQFLANMSHELRTPLNAIIGFSEMIRDAIMGPVAARYREYARDIHNCGRLLLGVISDVLDLSKVEAGRLELHEEQVDLAKLAGDCQRLIGERIRAGGLGFALELPPALPRVRADELRLKQIMLNLLSNAVKFTPAGGRVALTIGLTPDGSLALVVSDTGIGMKPHEIPIALEPFRQIDSTLTKRYEGTGLGLPLARTLTELHGGYLHVESAPGKGTTVTVLLPAARVERGAIGPSPPPSVA